MRYTKHLEEKRLKVLKEIKPICEAFAITDYDYEINDDRYTEVLRLNNTKIHCSMNSIGAVIDEVIGYLFINYYCKNRSLGVVETQIKNRITCTWIKRIEREVNNVCSDESI